MSDIVLNFNSNLSIRFLLSFVRFWPPNVGYGYNGPPSQHIPPSQQHQSGHIQQGGFNGPGNQPMMSHSQPPPQGYSSASPQQQQQYMGGYQQHGQYQGGGGYAQPGPGGVGGGYMQPQGHAGPGYAPPTQQVPPSQQMAPPQQIGQQMAPPQQIGQQMAPPQQQMGPPHHQVAPPMTMMPPSQQAGYGQMHSPPNQQQPRYQQPPSQQYLAQVPSGMGPNYNTGAILGAMGSVGVHSAPTIPPPPTQYNMPPPRMPPPSNSGENAPRAPRRLARPRSSSNLPGV